MTGLWVAPLNVGRETKPPATAGKDALERIPAGKRILDAGAGELQYKKYCGHLNYVSQDFAQLEGTGDGVGLQKDSWDYSKLDVVSNITSIPESDQSFDAVMCIEVLEHVPDPLKALRELKRILKPEGILVITAPFCSLTHHSPHFYYTGYSRYFWEYWLGRMQFQIEDMLFNGNYFDWLAQELWRVPSVAGRYAGSTDFHYHEKIAMKIVLKLLSRLSRNNKGSEEILAYGLHIRARRR